MSQSKTELIDKGFLEGKEGKMKTEAEIKERIAHILGVLEGMRMTGQAPAGTWARELARIPRAGQDGKFDDGDDQLCRSKSPRVRP